jgi:putative ABC transport system substrate-binding protein
MTRVPTTMRRRDFIAAVGGAAGLPFAAHAQQVLPMIGFLRSATLDDVPHFVAAFRQGLKEAGFVEGQNVAIDFRSANNRPDRLRALVDELVRRPVALIVGNNDAVIAAKAATTTIPLVFAAGSDPIRDGLVTSLNRPGGNITGAVFLAGILGAKRLELLRQVFPRAKTIGFLVNPNTPVTEPERIEVQAAAAAMSQQLVTVDVSSEGDIEAAFATFVQRGAETLLVGAGPFLNSNRERIVALAARHAIPAIFAQREGADAGGLMSYGTNIAEAYRQAGLYAGRILKGEKPGDLPVQQATKFEFVINLRTAKTLGLEFHPQLLATADEVIE